MEQGAKVKILLVEDNPATGRMYKKILEEKGYLVDHILEGKEALKMMQVGGYSLVLLDIMLPGLSGLEVLARLKNEPPKQKNGPIVMLTNMTDEAMVKSAIALGAMSYMDKSNLNPQELVKKVAGVLGLPTEPDKTEVIGFIEPA